YYFHAYEIMMDDLRDYRFYADDMKHPSAQAVRYIYENFSSSYYTPSTRLIAAEARKLTRRLAHRPFGPTDMSLSADQTVNDFKKSHPALAPIIDRYISDGIQ
ncbi:MAG: GSCFA domain-containing protein, partial [Duncaniella sp.]|nr:GSCFA domain-containing protein [Duncaniella sp.]